MDKGMREKSHITIIARQDEKRKGYNYRKTPHMYRKFPWKTRMASIPVVEDACGFLFTPRQFSESNRFRLDEQTDTQLEHIAHCLFDK